MCQECGQPTRGDRYCSPQCHGAARARHLDRLRAHLLGLRAITHATLEPSFNASDPAIEARNPAVWKALRAWRAGNLYLAGSIGSGKTYLARCVLRAAFERGERIAEIKTLDLFRAWRDFHQQDRCKALRDARLLLLDDLDKPADWTGPRHEALFELLDHRIDARRPTIITANTSPRNLTPKPHRPPHPRRTPHPRPRRPRPPLPPHHPPTHRPQPERMSASPLPRNGAPS